MNTTSTTIFDKILNGEIPCKKVWEDEHTLAFHDISPQAPVHVLVIPKRKIVNVAQSSLQDIDLLGRVLWGAKKAAETLGLEKNGYRLVMNNGRDGGQTVDYLHCHVLGGRAMQWPPG